VAYDKDTELSYYTWAELKELGVMDKDVKMIEKEAWFKNIVKEE